MLLLINSRFFNVTIFVLHFDSYPIKRYSDVNKKNNEGNIF